MLVRSILACTLAAIGAAAPALGQSSYELSMTDGTTYPDGPVEVSTYLDSSDGQPINGWSWEVCYDSTVFEISSVVPGSAAAALNGGAGPDYFDSTFFATSWTLGAVVSFLATESLPPGPANEIVVATYTALDVGSSALEFCLTTTMVETVILESGVQIVPDAIGSTITSEVSDLFAFIAPDVDGAYDIGTGAGSVCVPLSIEDLLPPADDTEGFSMGLSHAPAGLLEVASVAATGLLATMNGGAGPDFLGVSTYSDGWTVGVLYAFDDSAQLTFPSAETVIRVCYSPTSALVGDADGESVQLIWSDMLGSPPVFNEVLVAGSVFQPTLVNGSVALQPFSGAPFIRGDCNVDGSYDIADAIRTLEVLFTPGVDPSCPAACNSNGDSALDLADAIYLLSFVVSGGAAPPAPFGACGSDGGIACQFDACP